MQINKIQNSFTGQLVIRGHISPDDANKTVTWNKKEYPPVKSNGEIVAMNTDCIASISPKRITVYSNSYKKSDTIFVEVNQQEASYERLLMAYMAACRNSSIIIHAYD